MSAFDVHEHRHRMKLLRDEGPRAVYENRDGVACPACGRPFERLLLTEDRENCFAPGGHVHFCVVREDDRLLVTTHDPEAG